MILSILAAIVTVPIYVFYFHGAWFRQRSKFAQSIASDRQELGLTGTRVAMVDSVEKGGKQI